MAAGWQLYRLSPGMWTLLVFTWWILIAVFNQIPYIGPIATTVALPAFMMGFMAMWMMFFGRSWMFPGRL